MVAWQPRAMLAVAKWGHGESDGRSTIARSRGTVLQPPAARCRRAHATPYQYSMFFENVQYFVSENSDFFSGPSGQRDKNGRKAPSQGP
jgi:hypothetical protein